MSVLHVARILIRSNLHAPVGVMTVCIRGNVRLRMPAREKSVNKVFQYQLSRRVLTKGVVDANSPGHTLLTLNGGENLGRVLECDWSFT